MAGSARTTIRTVDDAITTVGARLELDLEVEARKPLTREAQVRMLWQAIGPRDGEAIEIRFLGRTQRNQAGYFDNVAAFLAAVNDLDGAGAGHFTLNPA